ncbi:MAG: mannose-1-phosphate guanylyltransferase [Bacteroidales bacterium]|nr:mannose-1-phosphate guanylyltransferase [Bacteroidales bacterium]
MNTHVVIMAGGVGSRLWPVSVPEKPKQFIDILGIGKTLLQMTVERFKPVCQIENFWVVTSEAYVDLVKQQLPLIPDDHILAEPVPRNTAPCIAYACWKIAASSPDANIIVTPADALVINVQRFAGAIRKALNFTDGSGEIVTVGVEPSRPDTGYGYIHAERKSPDEIVKVVGFKEKPDAATAAGYLSEGNYFWNAGIFVWGCGTIISEMRRHCPQIAGVMDSIAASFGSWKEEEVLRELFPTCEKISIDYAVMEKSDRINVIASDLGWSDLGSFSSIKENIPMPSEDPVPDGGSEIAIEGGNKVIGRDIRLFGCEDCIVHAEDAKTVIVSGLKDYIVAVKDGNVLVCPVGEEQRIKEYSAPKEK